jgi:hypothetical protein
MWNPALPSAPRSVSSPEPRRRGTLEWLGCFSACFLAGALAASGCSRDARAVRLPATTPGDEIYRITCEDDIDNCRAEARDVCAGPYEELEATGAPVEPPRVTSAPGPSSTGPRYQRKKWIGQMVVACGTGAPRVADGDEASPALAAAPAARAAGPERLCIPGVTQECLGPAACRGAQACLPDGNGFGPCDCGNGAARATPADAGAR